MREERKVGLTMGLFLLAMMFAVEWVGWKRVVVLWGLLFLGSIIIKIIRLVF